MLFHVLDNTVQAMSTDKMLAIENLLHSVCEGKNLVLLSAKSIQTLTKTVKSDRSKAALAKINAKAYELRSIKNKLKCFIEIVEDDTQIPIKDTRNSQIVFMVGSRWLRDSSRTQASVLLCENLCDCDVLKRLTLAWMNYRKWNMHLSLQAQGGGGATIYAAAEQSINNCGILVVVDSDKQYPASQVGETARKLSSALSKMGGIWQVHVLAVRELENAIPRKLWAHLSDIVVQRAHDNNLAKLKGNSEWYLYADLKSGLRLCDVKAMSGSAVRDYWNHVVERLCANNTKIVCKNCRPDCQQSQKGISSCPYIYEPYGDKALAHLHAAISKLSTQKLAEHCSFGENNEAETLAELIVAWGCASEQVRI